MRVEAEAEQGPGIASFAFGVVIAERGRVVAS
jgi:hypothetical protein